MQGFNSLHVLVLYLAKDWTKKLKIIEAPKPCKPFPNIFVIPISPQYLYSYQY